MTFVNNQYLHTMQSTMVFVCTYLIKSYLEEKIATNTRERDGLNIILTSIKV